MGETEKRYAAVVFDANVIIAALVREQGFNRYIVSLTPSIYPTYYVEALRDEIKDHIGEIAQKAGKSRDEIRLALESVLERVKTLPDEEVTRYLSEALGYVKDYDDSVYVATALYLRHEKGFEQVILVTWNKRDYEFWPLMGLWVRVLDPREFYANYLRPLLSPVPIQCLLCNVSSMEKAIEATLLYIGEHQYMVVNAEPPNRVQIETPCHRVLIEWDARRKSYCISPQPLAIEECIKTRQQPMTEERLREIERARETCKP